MTFFQSAGNDWETFSSCGALKRHFAAKLVIGRLSALARTTASAKTLNTFLTLQLRCNPRKPLGLRDIAIGSHFGRFGVADLLEHIDHGINSVVFNQCL